ncbi:MAG: hypothetical protein WAW96_15745, partial [Alphaproteobacteria bacterium]
FELNESQASVFKRIDVDLKDGKNNGLSDVENSVSVKLSLDVDGEITLLSSTRYSSVQLRAFAENFGWTQIHAQPSPLNEHFVQFLFERK